MISIRGAALVLLAATAACSARRLVLPDRRITAGAADFAGVALVVRNFEVHEASSTDDSAVALPGLRSTLAEYVGAQCRFRDVRFGSGAVDGASIALDAQISRRMHETRDGRLLPTAIASGGIRRPAPLVSPRAT